MYNIYAMRKIIRSKYHDFVIEKFSPNILAVLDKKKIKGEKRELIAFGKDEYEALVSAVRKIESFI
jgi:uncharacterized protein YejL (UPF0352 family)